MRELFLHNLGANPLSDPAVDKGIAVTRFPSVLGRHAECDHRINHQLISRRHCFFFLRGEDILVQDLGSRNGTFLNGQPLKSAQAVHEGDLLNLAHLLYFQVQLPAPPVIADMETTELVRPGTGRKHVLVVDDNEDAANTLALLLKKWGHDVQVAHDGPQALEAARAAPPDTVLLDLRLPGMDGFQVAERLRSEAGLRKAVLVAMTGYEPEQDPERSQQVGIDRLLVKPVDPDVLQEVLQPAKTA